MVWDYVLTLLDVWFHRYRDGKDIEGRCEFTPARFDREMLIVLS